MTFQRNVMKQHADTVLIPPFFLLADLTQLRSAFDLQNGCTSSSGASEMVASEAHNFLKRKKNLMRRLVEAKSGHIRQ